MVSVCPKTFPLNLTIRAHEYSSHPPEIVKILKECRKSITKDLYTK